MNPREAASQERRGFESRWAAAEEPGKVPGPLVTHVYTRHVFGGERRGHLRTCALKAGWCPAADTETPRHTGSP